jgi:hypothetical protein
MGAAGAATAAAEEALPSRERGGGPGRSRADPAARAALASAAARVAPVALARQRTLPVLPALAGLLPEGLRRGTTVAVEPGAGATSLAVVLAAGASVDGSWVAAVAMPWLGLAAATELGLAPERLLLVGAGPPGGIGVATVVAALVDAVDVVLVGARVGAGDARRLAARARERGAVLVALPGRWPLVADVRLRVDRARWDLPHRRLAARRVEVAAEGRGAGGRARRASLLLPGPEGLPVAASPPEAVAAPPPVVPVLGA